MRRFLRALFWKSDSGFCEDNIRANTKSLRAVAPPPVSPPPSPKKRLPSEEALAEVWNTRPSGREL